MVYKQSDGKEIGLLLGPSSANAFLPCLEKNWLDSCPQGFKPVFYRRKFVMVYTLVYRCVRICLDWIKFHIEITFLKKIFRKNG